MRYYRWTWIGVFAERIQPELVFVEDACYVKYEVRPKLTGQNAISF